jgi:hypothetical protein
LVLCLGTVHSNKKKERKPRYDPLVKIRVLINQGVTLVKKKNQGDNAICI